MTAPPQSSSFDGTSKTRPCESLPTRSSAVGFAVFMFISIDREYTHNNARIALGFVRKSSQVPMMISIKQTSTQP
jgi:hypothetical protein